MSKFKVGDKVKVVKITNKASEDFYKVGFTGEVVGGYSNCETNCPVNFSEKTEYLKGFKTSRTTWYCEDDDLELIENKGEVMSKTFKEVIADIKVGEVWVGDKNWNIEYIKSGEDGIEIKFREEVDHYIFCEAVDFTLQRKKVSFTEAFAAYEEGKEIESCYNKYKFRCLENGLNEFNYDNEWLGVWEVDQIFSINQVKGEWFIND